MPPTATLAEALAPLLADPQRSAVLLDVDGTLAPIVRHADDATVPESTRSLLIAISKRYGLVACVTGRRASEARRIVSIGSIAYLGSHGGELLRARSVAPELDERLAEWRERVQVFLARTDTPALQRLRVRSEDKGVIAAFHWRGAPDEDAAHAAVRELAQTAEDEGFVAHWGRKVLEVRPPVAFDKGAGVAGLLRASDIDAAVYVGDDVTDLDAFRALRELAASDELSHAVTVAVGSEELPAELRAAADLIVEGTEGVRQVLEALLG